MFEETPSGEPFLARGTGAVLYVMDLDGMRAFYETCFGMRRLEVEGKGFAILDGPGLEMTTTPPLDLPCQRTGAEP